MEAITEKTTKILDILIPEGDLDYKVRKILREDLKRRLTEFQLIDKRFQKKYGMTLDEFEKRNIIKEKGFSLSYNTKRQLLSDDFLIRQDKWYLSLILIYKLFLTLTHISHWLLNTIFQEVCYERQRH